MATTELIEIGYVVKTHGVKGHLKISFNEHAKELSPQKALFFLVRGEKVPFFIQAIEYISTNEAIVLLDEIGSKEEAGRFTSKPVWGEKELVNEHEEEEAVYDLTGYMVTDADLGEIGEVKAFYEMSEYDLIEVEHRGKEILIPFHDETVIGIDEEKKVIEMKLPAGILDL